MHEEQPNVVCLALHHLDMQRIQRIAYNEILASVAKSQNNTFFFHGSVGIGKVFLFDVLAAKFSNEDKIVLCAATLGIVAELLSGGRTTHSTFKLPIPCLKNYVFGYLG